MCLERNEAFNHNTQHPILNIMRYTNLDLLFTPEGAIVGAVTLALTILICRPRKKKADSGPPASKDIVGRFRASMEINYQRWHDGVGYDLPLIAQATPEERARIEKLVLAEPVYDWRVVEALCHLRTPDAIARLKNALATSADHSVRMAVTERAGDIVSPEERSAAIIAAVREAPLVKGLHHALQQIPAFRRPEIIEEVRQAVLKREGDGVPHCAGLLLFLHGKAVSLFDNAHRDLLLRFNTKDPAARAAACRDLFELIGDSPAA